MDNLRLGLCLGNWKISHVFCSCCLWEPGEAGWVCGIVLAAGQLISQTFSQAQHVLVLPLQPSSPCQVSEKFLLTFHKVLEHRPHTTELLVALDTVSNKLTA